MARDTDLDVDAPDKVAGILKNAADDYYEASSDLESAWQDPQAARIWAKIARVLETAADRIDKLV